MSKPLVILLGVLIGLFPTLAVGGDDFYVIPVRSDGASEMRQYYVTQNEVADATQARDACADGYHMASIWEIVDPSNLKYNSVLGYTRQDSGSGPPVDMPGWARTGSDSSDSTGTPGYPNCLSWGSSSGYGTAVYLPGTWVFGTGSLVWNAQVFDCSTDMRVWCVED